MVVKIIQMLVKLAAKFGSKAPKLARLAPKMTKYLEKAGKATKATGTAAKATETAAKATKSSKPLKKALTVGLNGYMGYSIYKHGKEGQEKEDGTLYSSNNDYGQDYDNQEYIDNSDYSDLYSQTTSRSYANNDDFSDILPQTTYNTYSVANNDYDDILPPLSESKIHGDELIKSNKEKSISIIRNILTKFIETEFVGEEKNDVIQQVNKLGGIDVISKKIYKTAKKGKYKNIFSKKNNGRVPYVKFMFCSMTNNPKMIKYAPVIAHQMSKNVQNPDGSKGQLDESLSVMAIISIVIAVVDVVLLIFNKCGGLQWVLSHESWCKYLYDTISANKYVMWALDFLLFGEPVEQIVRAAQRYGFASQYDVEMFGEGIYDMLADWTGIEEFRNGDNGEADYPYKQSSKPGAGETMSNLWNSAKSGIKNIFSEETNHKYKNTKKKSRH